MRRRLSFGGVLVMLGAALTAAGADAPYRLVSRFALGGDGGWDYLTADPFSHRLFVARATRVQVLDVQTGRLIGEIQGTDGVHGVALAPELGSGYTSNGRSGSVTVFDLKTLKSTATIQIAGKNPDAIVYEPISKRVFTFNGGSSDATAIDAKSHAVLGAVALNARPEFAVADGRGTIFANLEDRNAIAAIDARSLKVTGTWPIAPCEEPSGLAIDREHRRLFSVCRNKLMAVLDADSGRLITTLPIGAGVDGAAFDPNAGLAFSSNGSGTVTIVREEAPDRFTVAVEVPTQRGARTIALDETTRRLYLPTAEFGRTPAPTPENPRPRPSIVPGSFVVLVLEPAR
ncbi:MAG: YncE family protein [Thermoanaerobaculaceae bacterium]